MSGYFPRYGNGDNARQYARMLRWQRLYCIKQAVRAQRRAVEREDRPENRAYHERQLGYALDAYRDQMRLMRHMLAMERAEEARERLPQAQAEGLAHLQSLFDAAE